MTIVILCDENIPPSLIWNLDNEQGVTAIDIRDVSSNQPISTRQKRNLIQQERADVFLTAIHQFITDPNPTNYGVLHYWDPAAASDKVIESILSKCNNYNPLSNVRASVP